MNLAQNIVKRILNKGWRQTKSRARTRQKVYKNTPFSPPATLKKCKKEAIGLYNHQLSAKKKADNHRYNPAKVLLVR